MLKQGCTEVSKAKTNVVCTAGSVGMMSLDLVRGSFVLLKVSLSTSRRVILHLFSFPVRSYLEHWVQFRAPQNEKGIATLEQVQWRAPGLVGILSHEG